MFLSLVLLVVFGANIWLGWILGGWIGVGVFLAVIPLSILVTLGGALALGLVGMIFGKHDDRSRARRFFRHFLQGWGGLICLVWISPWLLFGLMQFSNNVAPATLPKITISNGEKTVIFQSMMHIGSPGFYRDIKKDMERLRGQDYVFFYEGVRPGTSESMKQLSHLMGMDVSEDMYLLFAEMSGLVTQDAHEFVDIIPSTNVDLSSDEIVALALQKNITTPQNIASQQNFIKKIQEKYPSLTPLQKSLVRVTARSLLNLLLRAYTNPALTEELKKTIPVFTIILDRRNTLIADAIVASPVPNIYIHYGALHYPGVLTILREKDPRWQEIARTKFQVIR